MGFYGLENPNPNTPQFAFPRRGGNKLSGTAIVHTAEMYGALNTAAFCMRRTDYGCYHTIVDDKNVIEIYPYEYETWQDSETNNWAVGISAASRAADWNAMGEAQREGYYRNLAWAAADFVTYMRTKGIEVPRRRISGQEARNRVPGFCAHGDSGISRSDPGVNFDWAKFFRYTQETLNGTIPETVIEKEEKMLYFADGGDGKIWIGDGLVRWHVPSPDYLQHYRNVATAFKFFDNGNVQKWNPEVLGLDIVSVIKSQNTKVELKTEDLANIADSLKKTLAPSLAVELAKRLAD